MFIPFTEKCCETLPCAIAILNIQPAELMEKVVQAAFNAPALEVAQVTSAHTVLKARM